MESHQSNKSVYAFRLRAMILGTIQFVSQHGPHKQNCLYCEAILNTFILCKTKLLIFLSVFRFSTVLIFFLLFQHSRINENLTTYFWRMPWSSWNIEKQLGCSEQWFAFMLMIKFLTIRHDFEKNSNWYTAYVRYIKSLKLSVIYIKIYLNLSPTFW